MPVNVLDTFKRVLQSIGGSVVETASLADINDYVAQNFSDCERIFSTIREVAARPPLSPALEGHLLRDVDLAVMHGHFGVAENGAVWITEELMGDRALPFICQHLAVVIATSTLVPTMQEAYQQIGSGVTGFGTFIAGPSKTADIEQSLVLGAHGPKTMTVFLLPQ